jgi:hypothetical protein
MGFTLWLRRRWVEFRWGHSLYLALGLSAINFILITYRLLIETVPALKAVFPHLWVYVLAFILIYPPLTISIGHLHRTRQLRVEQALAGEQYPLLQEILAEVRATRRLLEGQSGATKGPEG